MNVTLINPNRYRYPPVIPLGLEYLAGVIESSGYYVNILDLCFSDDLYGDIDKHFSVNYSDIIGVTIRNIDQGIYGTKDCFLDEIRDIVRYIKNRYNKPIVLGGAGFSIMPGEILEYTGGDYGVCGYGEKAVLKLLKDIESSNTDYTIIDGYNQGIDERFEHKKKTYFDYNVYFDNGGIAGFETQKGCNGMCSYCYEGKRKVIHRAVKDIIEELKIIIGSGYRKFHLCDSEFNQDADFCEYFLEELIRAKIDMNWVLYMKPVPYSKEMFALLKQSGAEAVTLSVDSYQCTNSGSFYSFENLKDVIQYAKEYDIKLAVDLLAGFPYEAKDSVRDVIDFFKKYRPETVGVSYAIRIHPCVELEKTVLGDENQRQYISGNPSEGYIKPVYYRWLTPEDIKELAGGDELFRIEAGDKMVNYERV
ncbi:B12-binding domain-containing radical SAM protein [candidate division KSB1 bacterium]